MELLDELMKADTAGDPMSDKKWTRKDTRSISREMSAHGVHICPNTAGKLLRQRKYSTTQTGLQVKAVLNERKYAKGKKVPNHLFKQIPLFSHSELSPWNYTIRPN
jgi:DDE family transposase